MKMKCVQFMKESTTICFLRCMQLTMVERFEMVKLLFIILSVFKIDAIKIENSTCYGQICFPYGYDRHQSISGYIKSP